MIDQSSRKSMTRGLTGRDIFPTVLAGAVGYFGLLVYLNSDLPFQLTERSAVISLLILGFLACATGGSPGSVTSRNMVAVFLSTLGLAALIVAVYGIFRPGHGPVIILAALIVLLWAITTFRRLIRVGY